MLTDARIEGVHARASRAVGAKLAGTSRSLRLSDLLDFTRSRHARRLWLFPAKLLERASSKSHKFLYLCLFFYLRRIDY